MASRNRIRPILALAPALLLALIALDARDARAVDRGGYSMEILVGGRPLSEYRGGDRDYVEALRNSEYSVRLFNHTGERVAVALSVDGLNSIDARTTSAAGARKWILGPYETITLDGWQVSAATARRFVFTTEEASYGRWLGRTQNLGLVAAAVFREKRPRPIAYEEGRLFKESDGRAGGAAGEGGARGERSERQQGPAAQAAPEASGAPDARRKDAAAPPESTLAATGIGRESSHPVVQVAFDEEETPAATLEIRYEYHDALVRLGILPPDDGLCTGPLARRERARGFDEPRFAPDPYRPPQR